MSKKLNFTFNRKLIVNIQEGQKEKNATYIL